MEFDFTVLFKYPWHLNTGDQSQKETAEFWHAKAGDFAAKAHTPEARRVADSLLDHFSWDQQETVLDVGAGPGTYAIPLARRVAQVTALDISASMLEELRRQAHQEQTTNIQTRCERWLDCKFAPSEAYDTVLCLNALGVVTLDNSHQPRLDLALERLRQVARRRLIILIPHADRPADYALLHAVGLDGVSAEQQRVGGLLLAMIQCGMLPNLRILERTARLTFTSLEEATASMATKLGIHDPETRQKLSDHLHSRLEHHNQRLVLAYQMKQALYWWERPQ